MSFLNSVVKREGLFTDLFFDSVVENGINQPSFLEALTEIEFSFQDYLALEEIGLKFLEFSNHERQKFIKYLSQSSLHPDADYLFLFIHIINENSIEDVVEIFKNSSVEVRYYLAMKYPQFSEELLKMITDSDSMSKSMIDYLYAELYIKKEMDLLPESWKLSHSLNNTPIPTDEIDVWDYELALRRLDNGENFQDILRKNIPDEPIRPEHFPMTSPIVLLILCMRLEIENIYKFISRAIDFNSPHAASLLKDNRHRSEQFYNELFRELMTIEGVPNTENVRCMWMLFNFPAKYMIPLAMTDLCRNSDVYEALRHRAYQWVDKNYIINGKYLQLIYTSNELLDFCMAFSGSYDPQDYLMEILGDEKLVKRILVYEDSDDELSFDPAHAKEQSLPKEVPNDYLTLEAVENYYFQCRNPHPHYFSAKNYCEYYDHSPDKAVKCPIDRKYSINPQIYRDGKHPSRKKVLIDSLEILHSIKDCNIFIDGCEIEVIDSTLGAFSIDIIGLVLNNKIFGSRGIEKNEKISFTLTFDPKVPKEVIDILGITLKVAFTKPWRYPFCIKVWKF